MSARIGLYGSFQKTYLGHGTDKALIGGLLGMNVDDLRLRDSLRLAADAKLEYSFYNADVRGAHPNTVILDVDGDDGRHIQVQASSVGGGEIVVNAIDGLEAGFSGHENTLVITHHDTPGMIASISGELAAANLNIATMRVFRRSVGGDAMVALELDGSADTELIAGCRPCRASIMWPIWPPRRNEHAYRSGMAGCRAPARQPGCGGASLAGARAGRGPFCSPGADARASARDARKRQAGLSPTLRSVSGMVGGQAALLAQSPFAGRFGLAGRAGIYALSIAEYNACMGKIVAAPTAAAAGCCRRCCCRWRAPGRQTRTPSATHYM